MQVYIDGKFYKKEKAMVSVFDHGFLYGDGIFETMRSYDKKFPLLEGHFKRLKESADFLKLKLPLGLTGVKKALYKTLEKNHLADAYVRLMVSRGAGDIGLSPSLCPRPSLIIVASPFKGYNENYYKNGVSTAVVSVRKNYSLALNPKIKSFNYLNNVLAKMEADRLKVFEALMLNHEGWLAEGTVSNVFFAKDGVLKTPAIKAGILSGITRSFVLNLARGLDIPCQEGLYRSRDLLSASEIFITNAVMEVMPVISVNGKTIGRGVPGALTTLLRAVYQESFGLLIKK